MLLAALVEVDQRRVRAAAVGDVVVERVVGEVGLRADEPAECREGPLERAVPLPEPRQASGRARPEAFGIAKPIIEKFAERLASPSETESIINV